MKKISTFIAAMFFMLSANANDAYLVSTSVGSQATIVSQNVMEIAYKRIGIDIKVIDYPIKTSINVANDGDVDALLFRVKAIEKNYNNLIMVPVVINKVDGVVISVNKEFEVNGWESIRDYYIGIRYGVTFSKNGTQGMKRIELKDVVQIFQMLEAGRLDVAVITRFNAITTLNGSEFNNIKILSPPIQSIELYHYLHKDNAALLEPLTKVLQQMQASGEIDKIREDYIQSLKVELF